MNKELKLSGEIIIDKNKHTGKLYKHQKEAIRALNKSNPLDDYRGLLVIPTGGGKTFTSVYWVMNQMINNNKKVLWLAHRHELLNQTLDTVWKKASFKDIVPDRKSFKYRIISGMHDRPVNIVESDDFIVASKDSLNKGSEYLEKWIKANRNNICIVIDEAHHAVAKTYRKIIDLVDKHSDEWIRVIGLTATPTRTSENEKGLLKKVFCNGICYSIDLNRLIADGILAKPVLLERNTKTGISKELTAKELEFIRRAGNLPEEIAKEITLNKERNSLIVNEYIKNKDKYGKTLIFAINIDHAIALNALFKEKGVKSEFVVSSLKDIVTRVTISNEENSAKINSFRAGDVGVLINVNILTEGTDIPNVQTVFLARQTTSSILLNQMIGRGLRGVNAGGTETAYIVSFIDQWKYKINWVNPKMLPEFGSFEVLDEKTERKKYVEKLIDIKLIENFAVEMDKTVDVKNDEDNNEGQEAIGAFVFNIFDEENEDNEERDCVVIIFDHLRYAYKEFVDSLRFVFKRFNVEACGFEDKIEDIVVYVKEKYFSGYDLTVGYNEDGIRDILYYYNLTGCEPEYTEIVAKKVSGAIKGEQVIPRVIADNLDYTKLSMSQLKEADPVFWRELRDKVFEKYRDEDGRYVSATGAYKSYSRVYFQIDHIIPLSKGGRTVIDNLQLLTRQENLKKGDKMPVEYMEEQLSYDFFDENDYDKAKVTANNILAVEADNIFALNILGRVNYCENKLRNALIYSNKVLKLESNNPFALATKGYVYEEKEKYAEAIKCLEQALKFDEDYWIYRTLGQCYLELKKKDIALGYSIKAYELCDGYEKDEIIELNYEIADIYFSKRKYSEAKVFYKNVYELDQSEHRAINNIGVCLERNKELDMALKCYEEARRLDMNVKLYINNIRLIKKKM